MLYYRNYDFDSEFYRYQFDGITTRNIRFWMKMRNRGIGRNVNMFEFGLDDCRFDLMSINLHAHEVVVFEFKQSRADFLGDKKWTNYRRYCNRLVFACPRDVIFLNELPPDVGLYYVFKWRSAAGDSSFSNLKVGAQRMRYGKTRDLDDGVYLYVVEKMLQKAKYRKDDLF